MLELNFDYVWNTFIKKSIDNFMQTVSEEEKQKYKVITRDLHLLKKRVNKDYEIQNKLLKKKYYNGFISNSKIDQHKIAACMCFSLIKNKAISYQLIGDLPQKLLFANYQIAFYSSVGIIYGYLLDYYFSKSESEKLEILRKKQSLFLPPTTEKHDAYDVCIIKMLTLNDLFGNGFDLISYSNIMFCLEEYNKTYIRSNVSKLKQELSIA